MFYYKSFLSVGFGLVIDFFAGGSFMTVRAKRPSKIYNSKSGFSQTTTTILTFYSGVRRG